MKNKTFKEIFSKLKKNYIIVIAIVIFFTWMLSRLIESKAKEYPIQICQQYRCLRAKNVTFQGNCVITERNEVICGSFMIRIEKGINTNIQSE